ncbi:MAG: S49 family peptidase [Betaproteobacteria bacterium]|nr:S49 family peptidase [Betaproteobacteria bacterium]
MQLPHLASRLYGTPLLLARSKLEIILSVLGERVGWPDINAAVALPSSRPMIEAPTGIAVIPIVGTLVRRTIGLDPVSGFTSYAEIGSMVDAAVADPNVDGILLDIDSPGGEAGGVFELGEHVRAADAIKPVWAIASDAAFSAAYAIACGASRVAVTRTGGVGSIGVIALHVDQSVRDAQEGYRYTAITAGDQKNDFSPHEPLDKNASARLQAEVDRLYGMFIDHVTAMRKLDSQAVRATEAGVYFGPDAVTAGLADNVGSLDGVLADFSSFLVARRTRGHVISGSTRSLTVSIPSIKEEDTMSQPESPAVPVIPDLPLVPDAPAPVLPPASPSGEKEDTLAPANASASAPSIDALAIAEMCQLAGHPEFTAGFLARGATEAEVRKSLLSTRADSVEIRSTLSPDSAIANSTTHAAAASNPMLSAIRKITGKV